MYHNCSKLRGFCYLCIMIIVKEKSLDYLIGIFSNQKSASEAVGVSYSGLRRLSWDNDDVKEYKAYVFSRVSYGVLDSKFRLV